MKRIKSACLIQKIHFLLKDDFGHDAAVREAKEELEHYKKTLERNHTSFEITDEAEQPDGSIMLTIKKQYNGYDSSEFIK